MEGFKSNPKMKSQIACFKEGGSTNMPFKKKAKAEAHSDIEMDKKVVKKAVGQHEAAKHKGEEKTELKLKNGGRCKKDGGPVGRYKAGGAIGMKKDKEDKKEIASIKKTPTPKPKAPSAAAKAPKAEGVQNMAKGRSPKPFFNEEPDDMTAPPPKRTRPVMRDIKPTPLPMPAKKKYGYEPAPMPSPAQGAVSDEERNRIMDLFREGPGLSRTLEGRGSISDYERAMSGAKPAEDMLRGIEAIGNYMNGGKVGGCS